VYIDLAAIPEEENDFSLSCFPSSKDLRCFVDLILASTIILAPATADTLDSMHDSTKTF